MSNQPLTARGLKIANRFPAFMRAGETGKILGEYCRALGDILDESEGMFGKIQRSHRLKIADEERDILQLAALLGFERADFVLLSRLYDKGFLAEDAGDGSETASFADYKKNYLDRLRDTVERMARLMLDGCGTIWALLEGTAILAGGQTVFADNKSPTIEHPDQDLTPGGFIHRVAIRYQTFAEGDTEKLTTKDGFIYLVENPLRDQETKDRERKHLGRLKVDRRGFFKVKTAAQVTGVKERCVKPLVINLSTESGVGFRGVVPEGKKLLISADGRGYLDGSEVTDQCFSVSGSFFDNGTTFSSAHFVKTKPPGSLERNFPRPTIPPVEQIDALELPLGKSDLRFSVEEASFDASAFDESVFTMKRPPAKTSVSIQLQWREREPFAVTMLIPADLQALESELLTEEEDLLKFIRAGLERFRAAGVKVNVEYFHEKWILGTSVIRDEDAEAGEGVDFNATLPHGYTE